MSMAISISSVSSSESIASSSRSSSSMAAKCSSRSMSAMSAYSLCRSMSLVAVGCLILGPSMIVGAGSSMTCQMAGICGVPVCRTGGPASTYEGLLLPEGGEYLMGPGVRCTAATITGLFPLPCLSFCSVRYSASFSFLFPFDSGHG